MPWGAAFKHFRKFYRLSQKMKEVLRSARSRRQRRECASAMHQLHRPVTAHSSKLIWHFGHARRSLSIPALMNVSVSEIFGVIGRDSGIYNPPLSTNLSWYKTNLAVESSSLERKASSIPLRYGFPPPKSILQTQTLFRSLCILSSPALNHFTRTPSTLLVF